MKSLSINYVLRSDGSIDVDATLLAVVAEGTAYNVALVEENSLIAVAVDELFTERKGARLTLDYVEAQVLQKLNAQPENFKALGERVKQYVRANAGEQDSGKLFHIGRGKGGGVTRLADQPKSEAK